MKQLLLRLLVLAGIAINVAFLLINLRPDRPHMARRRHLKVLLRSDPMREEWIKKNQFDEFGAAHDVDFEVVVAKDFEEILALLKAERDKPTGLSLVAISDQIADELRAEKTLQPMQGVVEPVRLDAALADCIPESAARSRGGDGKVWFLPKRAEVNVAVFLTPAVEDAYLHWEEDRPAITAALAESNGVGLPVNYVLEKSPDEWDSYDLFVAAWYWAHHPALWADGKVAPRVAIRTGDNEDAVADLIGAFYRHGLSDGNMGKTDAPAVLDALQWDALYRRHHLLAAECERDEGIDAVGVTDLFRARRIAWAPINQENSLWLHGGSQRTAEPGMERASDLGWATLPVGSSLELSGGKPVRVGRTYSFRDIHFWALPIHAPDPKLAFELAVFVTQRGLQQRETEALGLLPIRQDLRQDYPILFRLDWMQNILDASYHQIDRGSGAIPAKVAADGIDDLYAALYASVLKATPAAPVTLAAVRAAVSTSATKKEATNGH